MSGKDSWDADELLEGLDDLGSVRGEVGRRGDGRRRLSKL